MFDLVLSNGVINLSSFKQEFSGKSIGGCGPAPAGI